MTPRPSIARPLIVVPTYNEAGTIAALLDRLRQVVPHADVLVVDDESPDGTADIVQDHSERDPWVHLLRGAGKRGLGTAYRSGFAWGLSRGYDVVVQMDADLSHPPERVPALLAALTEADIAIGSRDVTGGDVSGWAGSRRLVSWAGNRYARVLLGLPTRDVTAGFKAWRSEALLGCDVLSSDSDGYCFQIENAWRAARRGLETTEVAITFTDRAAGSSKMTAGIAAEAMWRVLVWRAGELTARRPAVAGSRA